MSVVGSAAKGNEYFCFCVCENGLDYLCQVMDVVHVGRQANRKYFCGGMGATGCLYGWLSRQGTEDGLEAGPGPQQQAGGIARRLSLIAHCGCDF